MAENVKQQLINEIMLIKDNGDGTEESYRAFLESLSDEELESLYDEIINED